MKPLGQQRHQVDFEAGQRLDVVFGAKDVGAAAFFVAAPAQRAALLRFRQGIGPRRRASDEDKASADERPTQPAKSPPVSIVVH
jgi:hypothetical protein